jgi:hypothetical protein
MEMEMMIYRHGDVGLVRVKELPDESKLDSHTNVTLAEGEVTGHAHRIASPHVVLWHAGQQRYLEVREPADLTHEEHGTITVAPGVYEVVIQREYDYMEEMPRAVAD